MNIQEALQEQIVTALHSMMPGCTHDEHGSDCRELADAVLVKVGHFQLAQHQTCTTCGAGYKTGHSCSVCTFHALMAAETRSTLPAPEDEADSSNE